MIHSPMRLESAAWATERVERKLAAILAAESRSEDGAKPRFSGVFPMQRTKAVAEPGSRLLAV
jgi:hypothetical protein